MQFAPISRRLATGLSAGLLVGLGLLTSCGKDDEAVPNNSAVRTAAVAQYADVVAASYTDAYEAAVALRSTLQAFVAAPTAAGLDAARTAYIAARTPYEQTEAYRFYDGPIEGPEGQLNAWPLDENYIDYVSSNASTGIINNLAAYPTITKQVLADRNGVGAEANVSTGYHAIEFLLWGQDLSQGAGAGTRPYTDYLATGGTASNQARRGQYLLAVADLLVDDLKEVADAWAPNQNNYRKAFVAMPADSALNRMLSGIGKFTEGELYGERMAAYGTLDKEDEQSCFSDQTHMDFVLGQRGIANVYYGRYTRRNGQVLDGVGLEDVVKARNATADANMQKALTDAEAAMKAIADNAPYDQEILNPAGQARVLAAITAGKAQAIRIVEAAKAAGITITL